MKNIFCAAAAALLLLSACNGNSSSNSNSVRELGDYKNASAADSLIYYFGQLRATDYWQYAYNDTTLRSQESRDEYMRGVKAGLDAARDNDAYNQGLFVGVQLAMNMKEFQDEFGVEFNRQILINAISDGLKNDSVVNAGEANREFRNILNEFSSKKQEADLKAAGDALAAEAKSQGWKPVAENIYSGKSQGGEGDLLKSGQTVAVNVAIATLSGRDIDRQTQDALTIGQGLPGPITAALLSMRLGETKTFYTTAPAIFGYYYERYNLKSDEIITFTITTSAAKAQPSAAAEANDAPAQ